MEGCPRGNLLGSRPFRAVGIGGEKVERKVAIVAHAQTKQSSDIGTFRERMLFELVKGLHEQVGITRHDIDSYVMCSNCFQAGRTISTVFEDTPVGAFLKDETKVEQDGVMAVIYAAMRIMSGHFDTALVVANSLGGSQFRPYLIMEYQLDPTFDRQVGLINELSAAAFEARSYMQKFGLEEKHLDMIAARLLRNASKNPNALQAKADASPEDISSSEYLYEPLRKLHCYPPTDGACAVLLAVGEKAKSLCEKPIWITGMGNSLDTYRLGERELYKSASAKRAAEEAYKRAGITDPASEIDVAEISAKFAHQEPIICEALGLFPEGSGAEVAEKGLAEIDGEMPVCPSGGGLGAYAFSTAGLIRVAEACRQLTGDAELAQVPDAKVALAHGQDGFCAQHNAVVILSSEEG